MPVPGTVLVVDGANVVGSRPDGWWKDRAGAARRLHDRLAVADLPHDEVVLVLEGKARGGVPAGRAGHVRVRHASGSGDDAIVEAVRDAVTADSPRSPSSPSPAVTVVTADRGLATRVDVLGARVMSPSWLLDLLDAAG